MTRIAWVAAAVVVLSTSACFSRPDLRSTDGGISDGNDDGGDGDAPIDAACMPAETPADPQLDQLELDHVSAGYFHACAIDTAGDMWCWGSNDHGQLGDRTDSPGVQTGKPGKASTTITGWTAVSTSADHSCGIAGDRVYCWGRNDAHQSIPGGDGNDILPTEVTFGNLTLMQAEVPVKIFAGPTMSCAITSENRGICWGDVNLTVGSGSPVPAFLLATNANATWSTISLGEDHACALSVPGHVYCWGENSSSQLGSSAASDRQFADLEQRDSTNTFTSISVTRAVTCATHTNGNLVCFGSTSAGHLGNVAGGVLEDDDLVVSTGTWNRVSINSNHVCVSKTNNNTHCYGDNSDGALGNDTFTSSRTIQGVVTTNTVEITAGENFSCALDTTDHLSCWGSNAHGELGVGTIATKRAPSPSLLPIGSCESVLQIAAGDRHTCAIVGTQADAAGRLYCWGNNSRRQVTGNSMELSIAKPVQPFAAETFSRVATGEMHTCALRTDGAIRCWGDNSAIQLGAAGTTPSLLMPLNSLPWIYVAAGSRASCAIRMGGELFCWGAVPVEGMKTTPTNLGRVAEGGTKNWTSIALGSGFGLGTAIDPADPNRVYVYGFAPTGCQMNQILASGPYPPSNPMELYNSMHLRANVAAAQANGGHVCIHMNDANGTNKVTCLGENASNQAGPTQIVGQSCVTFMDTMAPPGGWRMAFPDVSTVTASRTHTCALDAIGRPRCWGANNSAELGNLPSGNPVPVEVTDQRFAEISTGADHTCGIADSRTSVSCWGENRHGQLGDDARFHAVPTPAGLVPP